MLPVKPLPPATGVNRTIKLNVADAVCGTVSCTVTVKAAEFVSTVGVPVINPVAVLKLSPVGSVGLIEYVTAPKPPDTNTG